MEDSSWAALPKQVAFDRYTDPKYHAGYVSPYFLLTLELWALLHFIMPTLFDSHEEFSEWFSKDIESHTQSNTKLNQSQLRRLHMILKPFMLRRNKKDVQ